MTTILIIICVAVYLYIKKFNALVVIVSVLTLIILWLVIFLRRKYLSVIIKKTEANLKTKMLSSEADAKEVGMADCEKPGDDDVYEKLREDLTTANVEVSDHILKKHMDLIVVVK